jgi:hypothetical protein
MMTFVNHFFKRRGEKERQKERKKERKRVKKMQPRNYLSLFKEERERDTKTQRV